MPGHHACAIARIERLRSDVVVDAFIARGKMIASLSNQVVQLKRENAALRENFAALTEGPQP